MVSISVVSIILNLKDMRILFHVNSINLDLQLIVILAKVLIY